MPPYLSVEGRFCMQNVISIEDSNQGVTQEERMLLRQVFDNNVTGIIDTPEHPGHLSSNQGEKDDVID
jgi:hypothetical protein